MPKIYEQTPAPVPAVAKVSSIPNCEVEETSNGGLSVLLFIDPVYADRIKKRANGMDLGRYLWENTLKRAIIDSVY